MNENLPVSADENKNPTSDKTQQQVMCGASWQLYTDGAVGKLKCRICGVYVTNGGTPKCLKQES